MSIPLRRRAFVGASTIGLGAPAWWLSSSAHAAQSVVAETDAGKLRGLRDDGGARFLGVPYAAATGGGHRFMAPQPVAAWTGVRDAVQFGPRCVQERETFGDAPVLSWYAQTEPFSEDCCVLNVYTPAVDAARRPVMVYIHGGGYVTGGGGGAVLDGSRLARFGDVVVVTLNHRLNVFGYTNLAHLGDGRFADAANAGQLDLIAALGWVQRNIAAFGGDAGNVTLFGQSGGGSKIMTLLAMPQARGLFHRAINMSGASGTVVPQASVTQAYVDTFLETLGIDKSNLGRLQELPVDALLKARRAAFTARREGARPVIDGRHIPASPMAPQSLPLHAQVPLLLGTADTEAAFYFANDKRHMALSARQVSERLKAQFGLDDAGAEALVTAFRADGPQRTPSEVLVTLISDTLFRLPMIRAAEAKAAAGRAPVYLYTFGWRAPVDGGIWGAPHAIDIPFAFGTTDRATQLLGHGPEPAQVSQSLMAAFVAFARTGRPDNPRMPAWKPYDAVARASMVVDLESRLVEDYRGADRRAAEPLRLDTFNRAALMTYRD
jgi:para-nitrobenzyl esterase